MINGLFGFSSSGIDRGTISRKRASFSVTERRNRCAGAKAGRTRRTRSRGQSRQPHPANAPWRLLHAAGRRTPDDRSRWAIAHRLGASRAESTRCLQGKDVMKRCTKAGQARALAMLALVGLVGCASVEKKHDTKWNEISHWLPTWNKSSDSPNTSFS